MWRVCFTHSTCGQASALTSDWVCAFSLRAKHCSSVFSTQFGNFVDLVYTAQAVWNPAEVWCNTALLWSSRNALWTTKLNLTFRQLEGEENFLFFGWMYPLMQLQLVYQLLNMRHQRCTGYRECLQTLDGTEYLKLSVIFQTNMHNFQSWPHLHPLVLFLFHDARRTFNNSNLVSRVLKVKLTPRIRSFGGFTTLAKQIKSLLIIQKENGGRPVCIIMQLMC